VVVAHSARNRFSGLISKVTRDTVMAQVEIQAGPHPFVCLLSREAADELGLEPGMLAVAAVKATNVSVEIPHNTWPGPPGPDHPERQLVVSAGQGARGELPWPPERRFLQDAQFRHRFPV
jgi:molybdopterin-binding protein